MENKIIYGESWYEAMEAVTKEGKTLPTAEEANKIEIPKWTGLWTCHIFLPAGVPTETSDYKLVGLKQSNKNRIINAISVVKKDKWIITGEAFNLPYKPENTKFDLNSFKNGFPDKLNDGNNYIWFGCSKKFYAVVVFCSSDSGCGRFNLYAHDDPDYRNPDIGRLASRLVSGASSCKQCRLAQQEIITERNAKIYYKEKLEKIRAILEAE